jgi:hypothetical protein
MSSAINVAELMIIVLVIAVIGIGTVSTLYQNKNLISVGFWDLAGLACIILMIAVVFLFAYSKIRRY